jgi:hypothetical protein
MQPATLKWTQGSPACAQRQASLRLSRKTGMRHIRRIRKLPADYCQRIQEELQSMATRLGACPDLLARFCRVDSHMTKRPERRERRLRESIELFSAGNRLGQLNDAFVSTNLLTLSAWSSTPQTFKFGTTRSLNLPPAP